MPTAATYILTKRRALDTRNIHDQNPLPKTRTSAELKARQQISHAPIVASADERIPRVSE